MDTNFELDGKQKENLQRALISAFPSYDLLEQMLTFKLNRNLQEIALEDDLKNVTFRLMKAAEAAGWLLDLVLGAILQNPGNGKLKGFVKPLIASEFVGKMKDFLQSGNIDMIFLLLKTIQIPKNIHDISISLSYRWDSLNRKEEQGLISSEELENERLIIIQGLGSVLELIEKQSSNKENPVESSGKKTVIADSDFFLLYPYLKQNISYGVDIYTPEFFDCIFKNMPLEEVLSAYSDRIRELLAYIVELAERYSGNYGKRTVTYGANIMLMINSKETLAEEIAAIYKENFLFRNGIHPEDLLGILYLPEQLIWKPKDSNHTVPIALPIYKTDGAENPKPPLLGAPFAAIYGVSIVKDVQEIKNYAFEEQKEEVEAYFSAEGLGKNIKSIASFRIGTPKNPVGVLNIDSNKVNILGDQPEFYTVFIANLDPILRKLSGIIEQFAALYVRKLLHEE